MIDGNKIYKKICDLEGKIWNVSCSKIYPGPSTSYEDIVKNYYKQEDWGFDEGKGCQDCGLKRLTYAWVKSPIETWKGLCGGEEKYLLCPRCEKVISSECVMMS